MKLISILFVFSILFTGSANAVEKDCQCIGLAANFPGYTIYCENKLIERILFGQYGSTELTEKSCEYLANSLEGHPLPASYTSCSCSTNGMSVVYLNGEQRSDTVTLEQFPTGFMYSLNDATNDCNALLSKFLSVGVCEK